MAPKLDEREQQLRRARPGQRLAALRSGYAPEERADLALKDGAGLALVLGAGAGIPYTCFKAGEPMVALYGRNPHAPEEIVCRGYLLVAKLLKTPDGGGRRVRSLNELYTTPLSAQQTARLKDLVLGRAPRLGRRQRLSPLAQRTTLAAA